MANRMSKELSSDACMDIVELMGRRIDRIEERKNALTKLDTKSGPWCIRGTKAHAVRSSELRISSKLAMPNLRKRIPV